MTKRSLLVARRYVALALLAELILLALGRPVGRVLLATGLGSLLFFRDPERPPAERTDTLYAPADGVVTDVAAAVREPWLEATEVTRISTFLALHNVHVTRSPVAGEVTLAEEVEGGLRPAFLRASEENRRTRLAIDGEAGRVVLVQIAGMVARRVTSWVGVRSQVRAGERLALIHFGSRADVLVPAERVEVLVRRGDRVRAGVSPMARYHTREGGTTTGSGREHAHAGSVAGHSPEEGT